MAGNKLPEIKGRRLLGISPEGRPVDNVTAKNRRDVDPANPTIQVALCSEDGSRWLKTVTIPRMREFPDVVIYMGKPYEVHDTRMTVPQYRECLWVVADDNKPSKGD